MTTWVTFEVWKREKVPDGFGGVQDTFLKTVVSRGKLVEYPLEAIYQASGEGTMRTHTLECGKVGIDLRDQVRVGERILLVIGLQVVNALGGLRVSLEERGV